MDKKDRLVELLKGKIRRADNPLQYVIDEVVERIADNLLANGVDVEVPNNSVSLIDGHIEE